MKKMIKDTVILLAITVIAGFILGFVYENTKELIAERELQAKNEACKEVFKDAVEFKIMDVTAADVLVNAGYGATTIDEVAKALSADGEELGYVLTITNSEGYGGDIQFTLGIKNDGTVNGISILATSETPGLGLEAKDILVPQYADKNVEQFAVTKGGAVADNEIDAISGATITSNAITNGVNAGLYFFNTELIGGGQDE